MYSFANDYSEICHPQLLAALSAISTEQLTGYGEDKYCIEAKELLKSILRNPKTDIHFVSGGTQSNLVVIASILKPYESVITAQTGHIEVHEAGAIESTGHKINTVESTDGKLNPQKIQIVLNFHEDEHMVKPRLVFISNSTELGSIYSLDELKAISTFCKQNKLYLYLDGARLGSALTSEHNNISLSDIATLTDVFYIGGTKNGALFGEAICINNPKLQEDFRFHLKQKGALLAKGGAIGIQFLELFKNNLFFELGEYANNKATILATEIKKLGIEFLSDPVSNQVFPILCNSVIEKLSEEYEFYTWKRTDDTHSAIRLVTSWATPENEVHRFINELATILKQQKH